MPCFAHDLRCDGESWATTSCPGGWMGWEAKQKGTPWRPCHAEREGSGVQERRVLVETELRLREQVRPAIGRESDVARRESSDEVVFGSADSPLCRKGAVVLRGGVLEREEDRAKKGSELGRGFVVDL